MQIQRKTIVPYRLYLRPFHTNDETRQSRFFGIDNKNEILQFREISLK